MRKSFTIGAMLVLCGLLIVACGGGGGNGSAGNTPGDAITGDSSASDGNEAGNRSTTLVFADAGWDSIRFHNHVARMIIEEGYGYNTDEMPGSTPATFQGLQNGDIDLYMEIWTDNLEMYQEVVDRGDIIELSVNFDDNEQGLYVPTYLIEGDPERGIEPIAPNLRSVEDLPQYWEVFQDPEDPGKGRIYGAITGWAVDELLQERMEAYGLYETFNYFNPGSDAAMVTAIVNAYENGEPWVGYYWAPTWVTGKYDLTLLEEADPFPPTVVTVAANKEVAEFAPEIIDFLSQYATSSELTAAALAYMEDHEVDEKEAAVWFLQEYEDLWTEWVPEEVADRVKTALQ